VPICSYERLSYFVLLLSASYFSSYRRNLHSWAVSQMCEHCSGPNRSTEDFYKWVSCPPLLWDLTNHEKVKCWFLAHAASSNIDPKSCKNTP
jgi:hypothetical protein